MLPSTVAMCERTRSSSTACCSALGQPVQAVRQSRFRLRGGQRVVDLAPGRCVDQLGEHRRQRADGVGPQRGRGRCGPAPGTARRRSGRCRTVPSPRRRTAPGCRRGPAGPGRRRPGARSWRWPDPTAPTPATSRAARARAGARPARRGTSWPPRSCAWPDEPTSPAIDENITNADRSRSRVSSCRFHAASTLARNTASTRSGVSDVTTASSSTPAAWITADSGCCAVDAGEHLGQRVPVGRVARPPPAPGHRRRSARRPTRRRPGASGPRRLTAAADAARRDVATTWRATAEPAMPVPPVISTVPARPTASGMVSTTLPMWRAWLRYRSAAGARRTSHVVTGSGRSTPASNSPASSLHALVHPRPARLEQVEGAVAHAGVCGGDGVGVADVGLAHLQERRRRGAAAAARRRRSRRPASRAPRRRRGRR